MLELLPHKDFELRARVQIDRGLATLSIDTVWPKANHPDPHRLVTLTLPPAQLRQLANHILSELRFDPRARLVIQTAQPSPESA